jgi:rhamnosyltransferase
MNDLAHFENSLLVILVIYEIKITDSTTYRSLINSHVENKITLFIYDNSQIEQQVPDSNNFSVMYHHDPRNSGVSRAYNKGFEVAQANNKSHLLLLDQDSSLPTHWVQYYSKAGKSNSVITVPITVSGKRIISPFKYWICAGWSMNFIEAGLKNLKDYLTINNGILISTDLFRALGGYDERIKLDFSDFGFLHKAQKMKIQLHVIDMTVSHNLSALQRQKKENVENRFKYYAAGNKIYAEYTGHNVIHFLVGLLRAAKLVARYRSVSFIKIFFQTWRTAS